MRGVFSSPSNTVRFIEEASLSNRKQLQSSAGLDVLRMGARASVACRSDSESLVF